VMEAAAEAATAAACNTPWTQEDDSAMAATAAAPSAPAACNIARNQWWWCHGSSSRCVWAVVRGLHAWIGWGMAGREWWCCSGGADGHRYAVGLPIHVHDVVQSCGCRLYQAWIPLVCLVKFSTGHLGYTSCYLLRHTAHMPVPGMQPHKSGGTASANFAIACLVCV